MNQRAVEVFYDEVVKETDLARYYRIGDELIWLPKSQVVETEPFTIEIPYWLAYEKGLI